MMLLRFVLVIAIGIPGASWAQDPAEVQKKIDQAAALIDSGKSGPAEVFEANYRQAADLLGEVLGARPELDEIRQLREKVLARLATPPPPASPAASPAGSPSPAEPAEEPEKPLVLEPLMYLKAPEMDTLASYFQPESYTAFYFTANADHDKRLGRFLAPCLDEGLYALRVVELAATGPEPDLKIPVAKEVGLETVPFVILINPEGFEEYRGSPRGIRPVLPELRLHVKEVTKRAKGSRRPAVEVGASEVSVPSFAAKSLTTVLMVSSGACESCEEQRQRLDQIPAQVERSQVVVVDVGQDAKGRIDWQAPLIASNGITLLPYYFVLDENGAVLARGGGWGPVETWLEGARKK